MSAVLNTFTGRLAAPPWLQRDWDVGYGLFLAESACSTSLTSKGLRLNLATDNGNNVLQHLPDFKGIETLPFVCVMRLATCSTSLTSKGLRRHPSNNCLWVRLAAPPWLQRDWDETVFWSRVAMVTCSTSLTSKGLRQTHPYVAYSTLSCSTSLTSKGLRPFQRCLVCGFQLAAPPWLQRDWDFKMIIDFHGMVSCSTSLTSKGLRQSRQSCCA